MILILAIDWIKSVFDWTQTVVYYFTKLVTSTRLMLSCHIPYTNVSCALCCILSEISYVGHTNQSNKKRLNSLPNAFKRAKIQGQIKVCWLFLIFCVNSNRLGISPFAHLSSNFTLPIKHFCSPNTCSIWDRKWAQFW